MDDHSDEDLDAPKILIVEKLSEHLDRLLTENNPQDAIQLIENSDNETIIRPESSELISIVVKYLTDQNLARNFELHSACERILIKIATVGFSRDVVITIIEVIDTTKSDHTVISALKALQAFLLRKLDALRELPTAKRSFYLEWILNSIHTYASEIPLSQDIRNRLDDEEEQLLEEEDEVKRIVSFYIYTRHFYEPVLEKILETEPPNPSYFHDNGYSNRNVLACFIIQLFGVPFAYLDLSNPYTSARNELGCTLTNVYAREAVTALMTHLLKLRANPLELIGYGYRRAHWPFIFDSTGDVPPIEDKPNDIFLLNAKVSIESLAVMFYAYFAEDVCENHVMPKVYNPVYLFEMGLYYVACLLSEIDEALYTKGLRLATKLMDNLGERQLNNSTLDLDIHKEFVKNLIIMLDKTHIRRNSQMGVDLLQKYIGKFETINAKYYNIQLFFESTTNNKILSLVVTIYKNIIAEQLNVYDKLTEQMDNEPELPVQPEISMYCQGDKLKFLLINHICAMSKGVETDILQNNDLIMAALNMLLFLAIRDKKNTTKFWDFIGEIEVRFLQVLRKALDLTNIHYESEKRRIKEVGREKVPLEVEIPGSGLVDFSQANQLQILANGQNTFDLIDNVLLHLNNCIKAYKEKDKN